MIKKWKRTIIVGDETIDIKKEDISTILKDIFFNFVTTTKRIHHLLE